MPRSPRSDATDAAFWNSSGADASITDLAEKLHMTLTGMKKHVGVLEQAGSSPRRRSDAVDLHALACADPRKRRHGREYRQFGTRFDELDKVVEELKRKEKVDGRKKRK